MEGKESDILIDLAAVGVIKPLTSSSHVVNTRLQTAHQAAELTAPDGQMINLKGPDD